MNYYTIKSTEPEGYVLDKSKLSYPAHVMDLRTGLTYVLETSSSDSIIVGGKVPAKQEIVAMLVTLGDDGYGGYYFTASMTRSEYEDMSEIPDFTHTAMALVDKGSVDANDSTDLRDVVPFIDWTLLPIPTDAVEPAPENN